MLINKTNRFWILILLICTLISKSDAIAEPANSPSLLIKTKSITQSDKKKTLSLKRDINKAILSWKEEVLKYQAQGRKKSEIESRLKITQGYISLGKFKLAIAQLEKIVALNPLDSKTLALIRKRLGHSYFGLGEYDRAILNYRKSLEQERSLSTINNLVEVLLNRQKYNEFIAESSRTTNLQQADAAKYSARAKQDRDTAIKYAESALNISNQSDLSSVRALINWKEISGQNLSWQQLYKGERILSNLPFSRDLAFTILNWSDVDKENKKLWVQKAMEIAQILNDDYLKSYVFLELGYFYEQSQNTDLAVDYARKAEIVAQSEFAYDSLYKSQQLAGRIYQQKGNSNDAITAYKNAIASLDFLRRDLATISIDQRINFETEIEPIYRSALKLLLDRPKADLAEAIAISDKLRLAQLQNYFGDDCFEIRESSSTQNNFPSNNAATINSIILENKTYFILQLPDGKLVKSEAKITKAELVSLASQWSKELDYSETQEYRDRSIIFYDLIIRPFEAQLKANDLEVLVFVHDGILRNLPMAALLDGKVGQDGGKFLAQKWASVSSIGLNFTPKSPQSENQRAVAFGLSFKVPGWSQLLNVASEVEKIVSLTGGDKFLNNEFTINNMYYQLDNKEYDIVHFATHGYFGGTVETSFLLSYEQKVSALELENILLSSKKIPQLLVLSACETARESDRSLLGLAGVAARSGVQSTLGTLWQVDDEEQSQIIQAFYSYWQQPNYNKATALQQVQIEQIEIFALPQAWAGLTLIGNYQ